MNDYYTKNFDPADYYGKDGDIIFEKDWLYDKDSFWRVHLGYKGDSFPSYLVNSFWFDFTAALDYFCNNYQGLIFDTSIDEDKAIIKYKLDLKNALLISFQRVKNTLTKYSLNHDWFIHSPYIFELELYEDKGYKKEDYILLMSAYSIMQIDEGITGLLEKTLLKLQVAFIILQKL
jgi:hypothetical protein